jgi:hypothetical protein
VTRNLHATLACVLGSGAALALPAAPALAADATGGTAAPDEQAPTPPPPPAAASAQPGGITLKAARGALAGRRLKVSGVVPRRYAGRTVVIQRFEGTAWRTVATAPAGRDGSYSAKWRTDRAGRFTLRAALQVARRALATGGDTATAQITVYQAALATWYGPGFYGSRTACGQVLTTKLVGVAHRTLPCGTKLEFFYRGRTLVVPVIDRGPYANGADWDLTTGAANALGFADTDSVGTLTVARVARR